MKFKRIGDLRKTGPAAWRSWLTVLLLIAALLPLLPMTDPRVRWLIFNWLWLAGMTSAVALPVGLLLALLLVKTDLPLRRLWTFSLVVLLFLPLYVQTSAWEAGFGLQGWFSASWGGPAPAPPLLAGMRGAVWVHAAAAVAWVVFILMPALKNIPPELEEDALLCGGTWATLRRVTLPRTGSSLVVAALWICVVTGGEIVATDVFQVRTYAEELYTQMAAVAGWERIPLAVLPGVWLTAWLVAAALPVCGRLLARDDLASLRPTHRFALGRWKWFFLGTVLLALLVLLGAPVANLCIKAGLIVRQVGSERIRDWSAWKLLTNVASAPWHYRYDYAWSAAIGQTTAVAGVLIGLPIAWFTPRGRLATVMLCLLAAVGLALPGPIVGRLVIGLLNRADCPLCIYLYDRTIVPPCLAISFRTIPLAVLLFRFTLRGIGRSQLESARLDGLGPIRRLIHVVLPQRWTAVLLVWLILLAVAVGDLSCSYLVLPPGVNPLAFRVFQMVHSGVEAELAGLCLSILLMYALLVALIVALWPVEGAERKGAK